MARAKSGTEDGDIASARWRETMTRKYGDVSKKMAEIGAIGGKKGTTGGFYANRELARIAGAKGGRNSRRGKAKSK